MALTNEPWFPEGYGQDTVDLICERLADGESLRKICRDPDMPSTSTVCKWLARNSDFAEQYARARELQADALFDDCLDIADKGLLALDDAADRRLQIETRKWMAGKLKGKYSDKLTVNSETTVTHKHDLGSLSTSELEQLEAILAKSERCAGDTGEPVTPAVH